ncbi:MAG: right-handed parallel beta-helix repeat-containing protein, partial [Candidatus Sumerlaeota bacterium]|nr:right-handed parallel beta-helix repeat-containing protein [Candidatus Sumerlaeota bacterium]
QRGDDSDNSYHVVKGADGGALDGFVISGGNCLNAAGPGAGGLNAGGPPPGGGRPGGPGRGGPGGPGRGGFGAPGGGAGGAGGGIHTTPDLVLQGGGEGAGGGMLNFQCAPEVRNCVFENNKARKGGAVYNMTSAAFPPRPGGEAKTPVFVKCVFRNNSAVMRGGGVSNDLGTAPVFLGCVFSDNETPEKGGGLYDDFGCSPLLINCLFTGNRAQSAAGMGNDGGSCPVLYHCTLTRNHAVDSGPSLYQGTGPANNPAIVRCVVWGNTCDWESPGLYNWHDCAPVVKESTIEDYAAGGAATEDPRLDGQGVSPLDCGYKPSAPHFDPARLPELLKELEPYRSKFAFEPPAQETQPPVKKSDRVVYVNGARTQKGDGASWATAFCSPTDALADAARDGAQVWVAAGVYAPEGTDRFASFTLFPGARLFGGFAGNEADPGKRDPERNRTVLSGDIGKPGEPSDNCYHVIIGADGASLDGFTISGGYADGVGYDGKGGGMINYRRGAQTRPNAPTASGYSVAVNNCIFTDNRARDGGAVYNYDRSEPRFTGCAFTNNRAENGGAVLDRVGVKAEYENCQFIGNAAQWRGGAAYFDYGSRPALSNCVFRDNQTSGHGGAIHSVSRASQLENTEIALDGCRFEGNRAHGDGGAVSLQDNSVAIARRCAFIANAAERNGGAVLAAGGSALEQDQNEFRDNKAAGDGADVYEDKSA